MIYRNIKTGAEIMTKSTIISPDWIPVEDKADKVAPKVEAPKPEPPKEEPPKQEPAKKAAPKKESAPKKRSRK